MALGAIAHVAVTVGDLDRARSFYHPILEFLGYRLTLETEELMVWESHSTGSAINFWKAEPEFAGRCHERYAPGLHHIAFNADSRHEVEKFYALLTERGVNVLDPPAEYNDYAPGYEGVSGRSGVPSPAQLSAWALAQRRRQRKRGVGSRLGRAVPL